MDFSIYSSPGPEGGSSRPEGLQRFFYNFPLHAGRRARQERPFEFFHARPGNGFQTGINNGQGGKCLQVSLQDGVFGFGNLYRSPAHWAGLLRAEPGSPAFLMEGMPALKGHLLPQGVNVFVADGAFLLAQDAVGFLRVLLSNFSDPGLPGLFRRFLMGAAEEAAAHFVLARTSAQLPRVGL